jgi:hypothetical protein
MYNMRIFAKTKNMIRNKIPQNYTINPEIVKIGRKMALNDGCSLSYFVEILIKKEGLKRNLIK